MEPTSSRRRYRRPTDDPRPLIDISLSLTDSGPLNHLYRCSMETPSESDDVWVLDEAGRRRTVGMRSGTL